MKLKSIKRRVEIAEKKLETPMQTKCVVLDFDGHYYGECGHNISQEQFDVWVKQQGSSVEIVIMKYAVNGGNPVG